ncbi:MAG: ComEC family competence protein, partial [Deltaproteobacteria bacterium]
MEVRAVLGVATAGVLAGELAAPARSAPLLFVLAGALAALWLAGRRRWRPAAWSALALAAVALGAQRMSGVVAPIFPPEHVARLTRPLQTTLEGRVAAAPERRDRRTVLLVEAEALGRGTARRQASGLVRVAVRGQARGWRYGDRLRVDTILRTPRNFENPGRFDYVAHLARRGVHVTAFVWSDEALERLPSCGDGVRDRLERWRARLAAAIGAAVAAPAGPVLQALIVGEEGEVDAELRDAFSRAGVIHILSISGLHVGLVAAAGFAVFRWLMSRSEWLVLAVDVERVAALASLGPVALYTGLAGLGVATLRSTIMVVVAVLAALAGRRADVLRSLAVAAAVLALAWPGAPLEISFQLSFVSVLAIVLGARRFGPQPPGGGWRARLRAAALVSPSALAGTA